MKYDPINSQLFKEHRKQFTALMKPKSIAIFHSNDEMPRNGDQCFPFRQNSDTFALCGLDQEETVLVLFPDAPRDEWKEVAFIKKTNEHIAIWEGHKYTMDEAKATSGLDQVFWIDALAGMLQLMMPEAENVYINSNEQTKFRTEIASRDFRRANELKLTFPYHNYLRSQPILRELAMNKTEFEVELMQRACNITHETFIDVMQFTNPGVYEYEIEAKIIHGFISRKANGHAYSPIVASGKNACVLHYVDNNAQCDEGELVLMDFGAEYANYAADLSRTIPVSGYFTDRQKQVYQSVLDVMNEAKKLLKVGADHDEYEKQVGTLMERQLVNLGLITMDDIKNQDPDKPAYKKYYMHGTSHHLGLDVHDLNNRFRPFEDGMVLTCEPGIYIPEENMGIRLENDILITNNGIVDLMANIPVEIEEIEDLMNR